MMFEVIGIVAVWAAGAAAVFYLPILSFGLWTRTDEGLSSLMMGLFVGKALLAVYVLASVAYLAVT